MSIMHILFILNRIPERAIFISGLILMIIGTAIWIPLGSDKPSIEIVGMLLRVS